MLMEGIILKLADLMNACSSGASEIIHVSIRGSLSLLLAAPSPPLFLSLSIFYLLRSTKMGTQISNEQPHVRSLLLFLHLLINLA